MASGHGATHYGTTTLYAAPDASANPRLSDTSTHWDTQGLCSQTGYADLWFPKKGDNNVDLPKAICGRCPVLIECQREALSRPQRHEHGVMGGYGEKQRSTAARREQLAAQHAVSVLDELDPWGDPVAETADGVAA